VVIVDPMDNDKPRRVWLVPEVFGALSINVIQVNIHQVYVDEIQKRSGVYFHPGHKRSFVRFEPEKHALAEKLSKMLDEIRNEMSSWRIL